MVSQNPEKRPETVPDELLDLPGTVQSMAALFGLSGLSVVIAPGQGWSCGRGKTGIQINVDPLQLVRERKSETGDEPYEIRSAEILHTTGHELGHARDIVSEQAALPRSKNPSENFFWNAIHDTVIDERLRKIPLFGDITDSFYKEQLFPIADMRERPAHIQLMHGILLRTVVREGEYVFREDIEQQLALLTRHPLANGREVNILAVMTNLRTTVRERAMIARRYIWPVYQSLLRQDKNEQRTESPESRNVSESTQTSGATMEQFEAAYENYEFVMHGHKADSDSQSTGQAPTGQADSEQAEPGQGQNPSRDDGQNSNEADKNHVTELAQVIAEAAGKDAALSAGMLAAMLAFDADENKNQTDRIGQLAGNIQQEMNLEPYEAQAYATALQTYRRAITETADTLLMLANESESLAAPRYRSRATLEGKRLHPSRLAGAALQAITQQPRAIWQPITPHATKAELLFGGFDIHLLVDVSQSMAETKAPFAASTGLVLCEAIDVARQKATESSGNYQMPDVRAQIIAFGSSAQVLAPLSYAATPIQKGTMYHHLLNPLSLSTRVAGALKQIKADIQAAGDRREHLVFIVTDGNFSDHAKAVQTVSRLPDNCEVVQVNIQHSPHEGSIGHSAMTISEAAELPRQLYVALKNRIG